MKSENMNTKNSRLKRPINKMPDYVKVALEKDGLVNTYHERPAYQQNDYISWITRAKRDETKTKRLNQMLDELIKGDVYMKMSWNAKL